MKDDRLSGLAMISFENKHVWSLDRAEVVKILAYAKSKKNFLYFSAIMLNVLTIYR